MRFGLSPFVWLCAVSGGAGVTEFVPARFGNGEHCSARFLRCSQRGLAAPGRVSLFCHAHVREDGTFAWSLFSREGVDPVYHRAVMKALRRARFLPADDNATPTARARRFIAGFVGDAPSPMRFREFLYVW